MTRKQTARQKELDELDLLTLRIDPKIKEREVMNVERDETEDKLREMALADEEITGLLFPKGAAAAQRAQLYTGPLTKVGGGRPDSSDSETGRKSTEGSRRRFVRQMSDSSVSLSDESEADQDDGLR